MSSDSFQPSTSCIGSFDFIVAITFCAVISVIEYPTSAVGAVLSKLNALLLVIVTFPTLSSAYIHKYQFPSPVSLVIVCSFSKFWVKLSFVGVSSFCVHWYFNFFSSTPVPSSLTVILVLCSFLLFSLPFVSIVTTGPISSIIYPCFPSSAYLWASLLTFVYIIVLLGIALPSILVTVSGTIIALNLVQFSNVPYAKFVRLYGISILVKFSQFSNA